jgi:hypothetical protein
MTATRQPKVTTFTAKGFGANEGKSFKWAFYRDTTGYWMLRDHTGYERTMEKTWIDTVPKIKMILGNHDMTADIS